MGLREVRNLVIPLSSEKMKTENPCASDEVQTPVRRILHADSKHGISTHEVLTPMIHFPIAPRATSRLTPSALTRQVIGGAGGSLRGEDTYQARLVHNISTDLLKAFSTDVWTLESEDSMISELQPEPLRLSRRESQLTQDQVQKCARMLQGLNDEKLEDVEEGGMEEWLDGIVNQKASGVFNSPEFRVDPLVDERSFDMQTEQSVEGLKIFRRQSRIFTEPVHTKATQREQRSTASQITPENSQNSLMGENLSFCIAAKEPSGFTPRHPKNEEFQRPMPRSPMMLNYTNEEISEKEISESIRTTADQVRNERRFGTVPIKRTPAHTSKHQSQEPQKMFSTTPRGMRDFTLWRNGHSFHVNEAAIALDFSDSAKDVECPQNTEDHGSITTRDFFEHAEVKKNRPKHRPIPVDAHRFSSQRFDPESRIVTQFALTKTPSPPDGKESTTVRTPTSAISNLFRKRHRSDQLTTPRTPRTPVTPTMHWRPFDDPHQAAPCSLVWTSGRQEDRREKMERAAYFKEKIERENTVDTVMSKDARSKSSLRNISSKEDVRRRRSFSEHRQSMDSLIGWKSFIDDTPENPPASSPLPPVPPLPSSSRLKHLSTTARDFAAPTPSGTGYKTKKPQGLKVETKKLRKVSREGPQSARKTVNSGGLRTAFRLEGRRLSFGKTVGDRRVDEVVPRR